MIVQPVVEPMDRFAALLSNLHPYALLLTCPDNRAFMYCGGKQPARPKTPPWKVAEKMLMRTMMERVAARNPSCQESVSTFTRLRVRMKNTTTMLREISNLDINNVVGILIVKCLYCSTSDPF